MAEARLAQQRSDLPLVAGIAIGVHQRHRRRFDPCAPQPPGGRADRFGVERDQHRAVRRQPLGHLHHLAIEGLGADDRQREEVRPLLGADAEEVGEAAGDEEGGRGPLAFEERIGPAGGGETHGDRRQLGGERCAGDQPRGEDGRLLGGAELEGGAGEVAGRHGAA